MFLRSKKKVEVLISKKKVEKPIDVEKTVKDLREKYQLTCQETTDNINQVEIESFGNLKIGGTYTLINPFSYRPQTEIIKDNVREQYETEQKSKWVDVDTNTETDFDIFDEDREYTIKSIKYECKKYGGKTPSYKYNLGLFVFLEPQKNDSNDDTSRKQLKMSYELQSNKSKVGKYDGWIKNTSKTYNDFLGQFKSTTKASTSKASTSKATVSKASTSKETVINTRKRGRSPSTSQLPSSSSLPSRRIKIGGKKTQKNRGGMKVQDQKFFENKKKNIQEKTATANLFGYRRSPERNPKNMIPVDPHGIIPFQSNFNQQIEDEGNFMDAKEAGLTFN